ncbi:hypothetical protein DFR42_11223 [Undibacterium pigrum]|uniref:Uncharacterized protein n=2 Tax=Undibacterium pigrum TaxID=401470 RepID=A0A318IVY4_9BURK|nr:hypothetical protein DFR42_11223 [Undibacterium pigrum]
MLAQLFYLSAAMAAPPVSAEALDSRVPIMRASEVVESAKNFLAKERRLNMKKFVLVNLSFTYYSEWQESKKKFNGRWIVSFAPMGDRTFDDEIAVLVTNEKVPTYKIGVAP